MNKDTNLTVAKICHEMANYLSVLNFIKEDVEGTATGNISEMCKIIDLLTCTMDFFRNVYADNIDSKAVIDALKKIYHLKAINLFIASNNGIYSLPGKVQGAIYCILYAIMKSSKSGDIVVASRSTDKFVIKLPENRSLPADANEALTESTQNNVSNILVNYAKSIASPEGYKITLDDNFKQVLIWKE